MTFYIGDLKLIGSPHGFDRKQVLPCNKRDKEVRERGEDFSVNGRFFMQETYFLAATGDPLNGSNARPRTIRCIGTWDLI